MFALRHDLGNSWYSTIRQHLLLEDREMLQHEVVIELRDVFLHERLGGLILHHFQQLFRNPMMRKDEASNPVDLLCWFLHQVFIGHE